MAIGRIEFNWYYTVKEYQANKSESSKKCRNAYAALS